MWTVWGNSALMMENVYISAPEIPTEFAGFKIAQVSDLHNTEFGNDNSELLSMLRNAAPDIIAVTGDITDSAEREDLELVSSFVKQAVQIAPTYYVTGNHEAHIIDEFRLLETEMKQAGVHILHGEDEMIQRGGAAIRVIGIDDPDYSLLSGSDETVEDSISKLASKDTFTVMLSHRPELFETYVENDIDLVLTGHAHGGQFRLPFVGGLIAPNQGFFPEYDAGLYEERDTHMVVSRGLGNSIIPLRFNNPPEVVLIELNN